MIKRMNLKSFCFLASIISNSSGKISISVIYKNVPELIEKKTAATTLDK